MSKNNSHLQTGIKGYIVRIYESIQRKTGKVLTFLAGITLKCRTAVSLSINIMVS